MDRSAAESWIRTHVDPVGTIEPGRERPWSAVLRVPLADGVAWFKACAPVQSFEPRLTAELHARWADRVVEVLAHDDERGWLLLTDAGSPIGDQGNPPQLWLEALPRYAELQRGETTHVGDHLSHGVPDLRVQALPSRYEQLVRSRLPLAEAELSRLRAFVPRFTELCEELASRGVPPSIQHDDLHMGNVYERAGTLRILDWGDSSIAHPFASLVVTFRFLEEVNGLDPADPWFIRLRDAYLEPWGRGHEDTFALALRVGIFAHAIAWLRQRDHLSEADQAKFDEWFPVVLRRAVARTSA